MRATFIDVENEVKELGEEVEMLELALADHKRMKSDLSGHMFWLQVGGLASGIEKVYSGCERIMAFIAAKIDGNKVSHDEGWHITLLQRMHNPYPDARDALLSDDTYVALNALRAFRHRERNSYGTKLDPEIVEQRAEEAVEAFKLLKRDIEELRTKLVENRPNLT